MALFSTMVCYVKSWWKALTFEFKQYNQYTREKISQLHIDATLEEDEWKSMPKWAWFYLCGAYHILEQYVINTLMVMLYIVILPFVLLIATYEGVKDTWKAFLKKLSA